MKRNSLPLLCSILLTSLAVAAPKQTPKKTPVPRKPAPKTFAAKKASPKKPAPKKPVPKPSPKPRQWSPLSYPTATPVPIASPIPIATPVVVIPAIPTATPVPLPTPTPTPEPRSKIWALLVGVSKYSNPNINSLRFPSADASAIRDALVDRQLASVPAGNVRVIVDEQATRDNIYGAVDSFLKPNVQPGDQVIIFLAGHGVSKGIGTAAKSYLLPYDVRGVTTAALDASAVDLKQLSSRLGELPASQFVVFADACRDDPTPGRGSKGNQLSDVMSRAIVIEPKDQARKPSSVTFYACKIGERAYEDATLQHGVFTYYILDAIKAAAVPTKPDGAVHMENLASYVSRNVSDWAKKASASGDFEFEQTPQGYTVDAPESSVVLFRVRRALSGAPIPPSSPQLTVETYPAGARVSVDGKPAGAGTISLALAAGGQHTVEVEAPGYAPVSRSVNVVGGLQNAVPVRLEPAARGVGTTPPPANDAYTRAVEAESRDEYEVAIAGYQSVIRSDPTFAPAYERLAQLYGKQGAPDRRITVLIDLVKRMPNDARGYALLSRAYSRFADIENSKNPVAQEPDKKKKRGLFDKLHGRDDKDDDRVGDYRVPKNAREAAQFARKAADQAVRLEPQSALPNLAMGFALVVNDDKGKNRQDALEAFGRAVMADGKDAANYHGLGYGIRSFAVQQQEGGGRAGELNRAVINLKKAIELRPDFYEAHRELGLCYYLLDDTEAATREYEIANSYRSEATDRDEYASNDVALASLHQQQAVKTGGARGDHYRMSSQGYLDEAQETSPDLKAAVSILGGMGLSTKITDYLPTKLRPWLSPDSIKGQVEGKIRDKLPGGIRFP